MNFEYDFKRRPVTPTPKYVAAPRAGASDDLRIVQHLCFQTLPWRTVEEFHAVRELFEQWRLKHGGQLKTLTDWARWAEFQEGAQASGKGIRRGREGLIGQARRIFLQAYVRRDWGLPGGDYKRAAECLTTAGYTTSEQDFKNARRSKDQLPEDTIPADAAGVAEFIRALLSIWPEFEWTRLVGGVSAAMSEARRSSKDMVICPPQSTTQLL
jgi:hypothetical protein